MTDGHLQPTAPAPAPGTLTPAAPADGDVIEARLIAAGRAQQLPAPPSGLISDALNHRGMVLAVILLATGALGIPLLWLSPRFSTTERVLWTLVATLYTAALIALAVAAVWWAYARVTGAMVSWS